MVRAIRKTRSTAKLGSQSPLSSTSSHLSCRKRSLSPCPPPNAKRSRMRTSSSLFNDSECNKENIPPSDKKQESTTTGFPVTTIQTPPSSPRTPHAKFRSLLRALYGSSFIGREVERGVLTDYLDSLYNGPAKNQASSLYISGSPGSGKTAMVQDVTSAFRHENKDLQVVFINCMGMLELGLQAVLQRILDQVAPDKSTPKSKISDCFDRLMRTTELKCVIVLDELDHLCRATSFLPSLLALPQTYPKSLRLIGIANTHTLTSDKPFTQDTRTLHFAPYTAPQLMSIVADRLSSVATDGPVFIPSSTLLLLSRKIANTSGDVRLLFSTLCRAIDVSAGAHAQTVSPAHLLEAIKKDKTQNASSNDCINKIRDMGLQTRLVLCAFLLASKLLAAGLSLSSSTTTNGKSKSPIRRLPALNHIALHEYYTVFLKASPFSPVSRPEFSDILASLEVHGLILLSLSQLNGRSKNTASITLASGVRQTEIVRGLFLDDGTKHDEIKELWDKEVKRIERLAQLQTSNALDATLGSGPRAL